MPRPLLLLLLTCRYMYDEPPGGGEPIRMLLEEPPIPIRNRRPDIPQALATVIGKCLAVFQGPPPRCQFDAAGSQAVLLNCGARFPFSPRGCVVIVLPRRADALVQRIMVALCSPRIGVGRRPANGGSATRRGRGNRRRNGAWFNYGSLQPLRSRFIGAPASAVSGTAWMRN